MMNMTFIGHEWVLLFPQAMDKYSYDIETWD